MQTLHHRTHAAAVGSAGAARAERTPATARAVLDGGERVPGDARAAAATRGARPGSGREPSCVAGPFDTRRGRSGARCSRPSRPAAARRACGPHARARSRCCGCSRAGCRTRRSRSVSSISPKTVGNHAEHIYAKIDAQSRAAAAFFAMQQGLLPEEEFPAASLRSAALGRLQRLDVLHHHGLGLRELVGRAEHQDLGPGLVLDRECDPAACRTRRRLRTSRRGRRTGT